MCSLFARFDFSIGRGQVGQWSFGLFGLLILASDSVSDRGDQMRLGFRPRVSQREDQNEILFRRNQGKLQGTNRSIQRGFGVLWRTSANSNESS